jgi:hypothetical protein
MVQHVCLPEGGRELPIELFVLHGTIFPS